MILPLRPHHFSAYFSLIFHVLFGTPLGEHFWRPKRRPILQKSILGTIQDFQGSRKSAPGPRKDPAERVSMVFAIRCFPILHCTLPHITFLYVISLGKCICRYPAIADARKGRFWEPRISKWAPKSTKISSKTVVVFSTFPKITKIKKTL